MILQAQALADDGETVLCYDQWRICESGEAAEEYRANLERLTLCPVRLVASGARLWIGPPPLETVDERGNPLFI